ncbi:MAG: universal stress protein [Chlorobiaceae bacterium]|nr:universal stress protein [Chlorobiaceae bacterium]
MKLLIPAQENSMLFRHITVALDSSPHSLASLTAAAELARLMQADLTGVFVEDINLFRMAELPCSHEIRIYNSEPEKIDTAQLERSVKLLAREAESSLQRIAGEFNVECSFRICRGVVSTEVIASALEGDLLVLGRSGRSPSCRKGLGSTARKALAEGKKPILLMRPGFSADKGDLLVLFDGSEGANLALSTAVALTRAGNTLHLLLLAESYEESLKMERELSHKEALSNAAVEFHHLPINNGKKLVSYIRMAASGLLILSDRMKITRESVHDLVQEIDYPVLLV